MDSQQTLSRVAEELGLGENQVKNTVELLDGENTVPFIARYRKEATGNLDEEKIRSIEERIHYIRTLEERKRTVLKSIEEQGKLTPELQEKIQATTRLQDVEDLYLPYRPKRRTRATVAREKGLEPLAEIMLRQETVDGNREEIASSFIDTDKGVASSEDALSGARDIVAEVISDDADIRKIVRERTGTKGMFTSSAVDTEASKEFEPYKEFSESVKTIPPHRILAMNRGEKENALRVAVDVESQPLIQEIRQRMVKNRLSIFTGDMEKAVADSYERLIAPAIEREIRNTLTEKAEAHAIQVFARNLKALLLTPPLRGKTILGIDPGYRTGCKVAAIDSTGKYLGGKTVFPHEPHNQWKESKQILESLIEQHHVDILAIGNGTASRETEKLVAELLSGLEREVHYTIVNEAGASVYSAAPVAKQEFPDLDASMRGNISIARRLLDPLSELVKIDPKSIGVGLYQHDVNQSRLSEALDHVVESCVNAVGVDLNTASVSLLKYISGINSRVAGNIVKHREEHGKFKSRDAVKEVKGLGENSYIQCAGFLRIPDSDVFFDSTAVHPESYGAADRLLKHLGLALEEVKTDGKRVRVRIHESKQTIESLARECGCGKETMADIVDSLEKPSRDLRDEMPLPILRSDVLSMEDLTEGMVLKGTVRNVVDFGAFVDIGVKQDGLVHISRMAKKYVKNPLDIVKVGDIVDVKILQIDLDRGRIALSMVIE